MLEFSQVPESSQQPLVDAIFRDCTIVGRARSLQMYRPIGLRQFAYAKDNEAADDAEAETEEWGWRVLVRAGGRTELLDLASSGDNEFVLARLHSTNSKRYFVRRLQALGNSRYATAGHSFAVSLIGIQPGRFPQFVLQADQGRPKMISVSENGLVEADVPLNWDIRATTAPLPDAR
jgi:hypothetical protein